MLGSPHDRLFKHTFGHPENAASVLRTVLPQALLERLDLSTLELAPGSFVDAALSERHADLLYRVQLGGHPARVYLLFDHQSGVDRQMPLRLLRYMTRIWTAEADAGLDKLPPIIPCLLYHGDGPWSGPRSLRDQLDIGPHLPVEATDGLVPNFRFVLVDLSGHTDAELQTGALTAMAAMALLLFKHARHAHDLLDRIVRWSQVLRQVAAAPNGLRAIEAFARYILQVSEGVTAPDLGRVLLAELGRDAEEAVMTAADQLIQQGRAVGRADVVLKLITLRFGPPDRETEARVRAASLDTLDRWTEAILTAPDLETLLGG